MLPKLGEVLDRSARMGKMSSEARAEVGADVAIKSRNLATVCRRDRGNGRRNRPCHPDMRSRIDKGHTAW